MHEIIIIQEMINEKQKNLMKITATDAKLLQEKKIQKDCIEEIDQYSRKMAS